MSNIHKNRAYVHSDYGYGSHLGCKRVCTRLEDTSDMVTAEHTASPTPLRPSQVLKTNAFRGRFHIFVAANALLCHLHSMASISMPLVIKLVVVVVVNVNFKRRYWISYYNYTNTLPVAHTENVCTVHFCGVQLTSRAGLEGCVGRGGGAAAVCLATG